MSPEASTLVWLAEPFPVEVSERSQPIQLHQHGNGPESGRIFRGFQIQDSEANVRKFSDGDKRV